MDVDLQRRERAACDVEPVRPECFNPHCELPYGLTTEQIRAAMVEFCDFLTLINSSLHEAGIERLELTMMPANFSSLVGEFMGSRIPRHCPGLVENRYHNGHPDLLPADYYPGDAVQYGTDGIEIKASRYESGWQGHNAENSWLMVFVFESNRPRDTYRNLAPIPFRFVKVVGALLDKEDWSTQPRGATSRRTPTAGVKASGKAKMEANWIYWPDKAAELL